VHQRSCRCEQPTCRLPCSPTLLASRHAVPARVLEGSNTHWPAIIELQLLQRSQKSTLFCAIRRTRRLYSLVLVVYSCGGQGSRSRVVCPMEWLGGRVGGQP